MQSACNLPASIQPVDIVNSSVSGYECGTPTCTINNLQSFCKSPNVYEDSYSNYCINTDAYGPGQTESYGTLGTQLFKAACPDALAIQKDDAPSTYACNTVTNYNFIWCP